MRRGNHSSLQRATYFISQPSWGSAKNRKPCCAACRSVERDCLLPSFVRVCLYVYLMRWPSCTDLRIPRPHEHEIRHLHPEMPPGRLRSITSTDTWETKVYVP